jgi:hypothetical protein
MTQPTVNRSPAPPASAWAWALFVASSAFALASAALLGCVPV